MLRFIMVVASPWLLKFLITNCALYSNVVVLVAMLLQRRSCPERIYGAEVAI